MRHPFASAATIAAAACLALPLAAEAQTSDVAAIQRQLETLQSTLEEQQRLLQEQAAEIQQLREQIQGASAAPAQVAEQRPAVQPTPSPTDSVRITTTGPRPIIISADQRNSIAPRAVVQLDMADYDEDPNVGALDYRRGSVGGNGNRETNAARDFSDGAYFRRARVGFEGMIARDFNYRVMLELGGSGTEGPTRINDAWISYTALEPLVIQLGAFSPPANMDDGTSIEHLVFIERSSAAELARSLAGADGRIGIGVRGSGSRWMGALTLTSRTVNDAEVFDSQLALVGRTGFLVATSDDYNAHAGLSGTWVEHLADQGAGVGIPVRFRERPEIRIDSARLIDTGSIDADHAYVAGVEFGANWKNFYVQAENFWFGLDRPQGSTLPDPSFGGFYAQTSWVVTGEARRYDPANGSFQGPRPATPFSAAGGIGAWELALRYSNMDLNFHEGVLGTAALVDAVRGGEQNIWTFGINWHVNSNLRFLFNYLHIDVTRLNPAGPTNATPFGPGPATPPFGVDIGQTLDVYALRSQFNF